MIKMQNIPGLLMMLATVSCSSLPDAKKNADESQVRSGYLLTGYDSYYLSQGEKFPLEKIEGKFYVVFRVADSVAMKEALDAAGATWFSVSALIDPMRYTNVDPEKKIDDGEVKDNELPLARSENTAGGTFVNCKWARVEGNYKKVAVMLSLAVYWSPYYRLSDGSEMGITEMFTVVLKPGTTVAQLEKLATENGVEMIGRDVFTSNWYHLVCTRFSSGHALEMANLFYESGLFEDAFPNTIEKITLH